VKQKKGGNSCASLAGTEAFRSWTFPLAHLSRALHATACPEACAALMHNELLFSNQSNITSGCHQEAKSIGTYAY
jgi:hypothetical protein